MFKITLNGMSGIFFTPTLFQFRNLFPSLSFLFLSGLCLTFMKTSSRISVGCKGSRVPNESLNSIRESSVTNDDIQIKEREKGKRMAKSGRRNVLKGHQSQEHPCYNHIICSFLLLSLEKYSCLLWLKSIFVAFLLLSSNGVWFTFSNTAKKDSQKRAFHKFQPYFWGMLKKF